MGGCPVLFGIDERQLCGHYAVYYVLSMERGTKVLDYRSRWRWMPIAGIPIVTPRVAGCRVG
ncbi:hypothetical protein KCP69_08620 [Salmonella enterica subsp. enterica]|nr:hypothetical protein KCP69_08620 [Salmonella enterica subsp. enterica]